tara:strand:+ start:1236 stop:1949 length:714 start_codon:yes stop_codon:yes gene_type:complete
MISVLIPVYNTSAYFLSECLKSCLSQTISDYEIVIVDNGSDNLDTLIVLSEFENNEKITIVQCAQQRGKKNLSVALNYGLLRCKYDLVARMDSDDVMYPDRLEKQLNFMINNPNIDILGAQIKIIPQGNITEHQFIVDKDFALRSYWLVNHPTVMFRKSKIMDIGGYKETPTHFAEDYELWLRSLRNNLKIRNMPDVVLKYRYHDNNLTKETQRDPNYFDDLESQRNKLKEVYDDID